MRHVRIRPTKSLEDTLNEAEDDRLRHCRSAEILVRWRKPALDTSQCGSSRRVRWMGFFLLSLKAVPLKRLQLCRLSSVRLPHARRRCATVLSTTWSLCLMVRPKRRGQLSQMSLRDFTVSCLDPSNERCSMLGLYATMSLIMASVQGPTASERRRVHVDMRAVKSPSSISHLERSRSCRLTSMSGVSRRRGHLPTFTRIRKSTMLRLMLWGILAASVSGSRSMLNAILRKHRSTSDGSERGRLVVGCGLVSQSNSVLSLPPSLVKRSDMRVRRKL
mmetsp:Transcript_43079/g.108821  ORF Transcript_43079/g.108821 Transcript_43079/m.108821 type:complete len:276 (-) Transcript_43079:531-1358(-)